ncbi:MAG: HAD-IB family hydrolase [Deltaproteobacteria bacterium]|nr:HAD-IB family hydrolase [Deltaproteobacteria bacterium]MBW2420156.1 HAD-IB family hydrolase [Deltaproteobacteria bacterium]
MALRAELTRGITASPEGPKIGAFFDVDRTLLAGYSATAFFQDKLSSRELSFADFLQSTRAALRFGLEQTSFPTLIEETSSDFRGRSAAELEELGARIFAERLATEIYPESRALVSAHQRRGHTVAIISSATHFQVDAVARELGIETVLCTELEMEEGHFTGKVMRPACFREGKLHAAQGLAARQGVDLDQSFFYSDSYDDISLLEGVGNPKPVNPDKKLSEIAEKRGWPVLDFASRGRPSAREILRLGLSLSALGPAAMVGIPAALATGSVRRGFDLGISTYSDLSTALTGVELEVEGEQHLWSHRPAVFIFNHQTGLDTLLMSKLLRKDVVGVAKAELSGNPIMGPLLRATGTVFVERSSRGKAAEAMQPAVDALADGLSLVIAPEGTRSSTPRLGPFKKGAFHVAMQAGVPIVPVIIRNAGDALPNKTFVVRPATVEVVIHPPIPTTDWSPKELDARIEKIQRLFQETLDDA